MTLATSFGCERNGTWLDLIRVVVAPIRFAWKRSSSGLIARSSEQTMYQGLFIHGKGTPPERSSLPPTRDKELVAQRRVILVRAAPERGPGQRRDLPDASHLDAEVVGLQVNRGAARPKHLHQRIRDLPPDPFLHREALRIQAYQPSEL